MKKSLARLSGMFRWTVVALVLASGGARAAECEQGLAPPAVNVAIAATEHVKAGSATEVRWSSIARDERRCESALFLVLMTDARVRFEGKGFLAMPPGDKGPYGIAESMDKTRVFIPLHALPATAS